MKLPVVPDYVNTFPSGEAGWIWKKVIGITPSFLSLTPIIRQPVTIGSGCENIIIGSNIKTPGTIGNNCKNITIEAIDGVWSIGNNCKNIHIKYANNLVMGDGCEDIHIQNLTNVSMEGGMLNTNFMGKMSDMQLTNWETLFLYWEQPLTTKWYGLLNREYRKYYSWEGLESYGIILMKI
jgi:hypothetical protein